MSDAPVLRLANLQRRFKSGSGQLVVLDGVDLTIVPGEIVGLVGQSGAGKSSLLHAAGALDRPSGGDVEIAGAPVWSLSEDERTRLRRERIGFVYQFHHLLPEFDALDNVALPALIAGRSSHDARLEAARLLGGLGLSERINHQPAQLSGGEQQRVAIARAIAKRPEVLLCDEPTGALDVRTGIVVLEALDRVNRELGTLTVIITHNAVMAEMADRVIRFSDGKVQSQHRNATRASPATLRW